MFSCFNPDKTPGRRCEWKGGNLHDFVRQFNDSRGTTYQLAECLDTHQPNIPSPGLKQPEVLLKGRNDERPMVIERKQVVAESYAIHHGNLHVLYKVIPEALARHFGDALYALDIADASLQGKRKREVQAATDEIVNHVVANIESVKAGAFVGSQRPFPWRFGRVPDQMRADNSPEAGIGVQIHESNSQVDNPQAILRQVEEAYAETKMMLERRLTEAAPKFIAHQDHLKVVVLEFYGDCNLLDEDDAKRMVTAVGLPALIDEVWVAQHEWISEWDYEIGYERVR
jgi:hypothetical protein